MMSLVGSCVLVLSAVQGISCPAVADLNATFSSRTSNPATNQTMRVPRILAKQYNKVKSQRIQVYDKNKIGNDIIKGARRKLDTTTQSNLKHQTPNLKNNSLYDFVGKVLKKEDSDSINIDHLLSSSSEREVKLATRKVTTEHPAFTTHSTIVTRFIPDPNLLDMVQAKGARIHRMKKKNALCHRNVLIPEGPKYDSAGRAYLRAYRGSANRSFDVTKRPQVVLPYCCNCCKKSVLGCE